MTCTIFIYSDSRGKGRDIKYGRSSLNKFSSKPRHGIIKGNLHDVLSNREVCNWSVVLHHDIPREGEGTLS